MRGFPFAPSGDGIRPQTREAALSNTMRVTVTTLGTHSPRLAELRELKTKAGRLAQRRFAIEGRTMLDEAKRSGRSIEAIYATEAAAHELASRPEYAAVPLFIVAEKALERASDLTTPPGIIAVLPTQLSLLAEVLAGGEPALLLAAVADPGNVGTLLRSAEIFGVRRAIFANTGVEPHNPKVVRGSMGALLRLQVAVCDAEDLLQTAAAHGYDVVATARDGDPLPSFAWPPRCLIAVGNERHGVTGWLPRYDRAVAIPQGGEGESLNAAVAGSIVLYAFAQNRD